MSNEKVVVDRVPFDTLEVGCKYESRCGEIWEVILDSPEKTPYRFLALMEIKHRQSWFTEEGDYLYGHDEEDGDDLICKVVECKSQFKKEQIETDAINPSHYKHNGIETIDYMKAVSTEEEFKGHLRLTAIKYISRLGKKDCPKQEIKKAIWYLNKLLEEYEAENNE